jgi:hypothetical protein
METRLGKLAAAGSRMGLSLSLSTRLDGHASRGN